MADLRALIVDDEPLARRELARLLADCEGVRVAGEAEDLASALLAAADTPDVVFLDVRLGREDGFALVPALPSGTAVVFVTAFDEYAVRAFEVHALDYLLKPVEPSRLAATVDRLCIERTARHPSAAPPPPPARLSLADWLLLERGSRTAFARVGSVAAITAEGDYSRVHTVGGESVLVHRSLADWAERLPPGSFVRVHRSAVVNLQHVLEVRRATASTSHVAVRGVERPVEMSRRAAAALRRRLR